MKQCEYCCKEFDESVFISKYSTGRFCSKKCARGYSTKNEQSFLKIVYCTRCGKEIEVDKRTDPKKIHCLACREKRYSEKLEEIHNNYRKKHPIVYREYKHRIVDTQKVCLYCGEEIVNATSKTKFCSIGCNNNYKWKCKCEEIERNNGFEDFRQNANLPKKYLIYKRGHRCEICGNSEWMEKPIPLILDHIDGNPDLWKLNNLRLVCGNCDMQLPTYKSKNKNSKNSKRASHRRKSMVQ